MGHDQDKGIHARNQDFRKYDQVEKTQSYHLVEHADTDAFDEDYEIQTCDISQFTHGGEEGKKRFAEQLGSALEGIGFAVLTGHGIDPDLFDRAYQKNP